MKRVTTRGSFSAAAFWAGLTLFLISLVFYYFSVLRIDYMNSPFLNLKPGPDAVEYFAQAKALAVGRLPTIRIGREELPSSFPPGYPALMLPWLKVLPAPDAILAPFRTSQTAGALLLVSTFLFYLYLSMPLAGGVASLILATLPGFYTFCRSSMSDASAWLFYAVAFIFAYLGLKEEVRWKVYVSALVLGLSINLRLQSVFFVPLLLAMALFPIKVSPGRWLFHCLAAGALFLVAAAPFFLVNYLQFHSPLKLGGNFWYPPRQLFSLSFIPDKNVAMLWREFTLTSNRYLAANTFGTGTVFVPSFLLLILCGVAFIRAERALIPLVAALGLFSILTAAYLYPDGRYYLQLLILLIPMAVAPVVWALQRIRMPRSCVAAGGILILFLATCLGYPSRSGYKQPPKNHAQTVEAVHFQTGESPATWFLAQRDFAQRYGNSPGVVLSDVDPVYLNTLLPPRFLAAPIDENQQRRWSSVWHYGPEQAASLVDYGLNHSMPVYALVVPRHDLKTALPRLPRLSGYHWVQLPSGQSEIVLQLNGTRP